jgi:sugar phosphate isomerase/epimerase
MTFGMPAILETKMLADCAAFCHELGLGFIELNMNLPQYQADKIDVAAFAEIAEQYAIFYTIHLDENCNPCDFNKRVAAAYTDTVVQTIAIAKRLSVPILNMHLSDGVYFTLPDKKVFLFDEYENIYLQKLAAFRDACTMVIGDSGVLICIENANASDRAAFWGKSVDLLLESSAFALTFDIGHNASADYSAEPIIMSHVDRLRHFHIHDALGKRNHLTLGTGELDLPRYLELAREHDCRCVLETKTIDAMRQSVKWLKERGWV